MSKMRTGRKDQPINPAAKMSGMPAEKKKMLSGYMFGSGGSNQNNMGGGVKASIGKRGSVGANVFRAKDDYGKFGSYSVEMGISIPINKKK
jgi:hypothetical protein